MTSYHIAHLRHNGGSVSICLINEFSNQQTNEWVSLKEKLILSLVSTFYSLLPILLLEWSRGNEVHAQ